MCRWYDMLGTATRVAKQVLQRAPNMGHVKHKHIYLWTLNHYILCTNICTMKPSIVSHSCRHDLWAKLVLQCFKKNPTFNQPPCWNWTKDPRWCLFWASRLPFHCTPPKKLSRQIFGRFQHTIWGWSLLHRVPDISSVGFARLIHYECGSSLWGRAGGWLLICSFEHFQTLSASAQRLATQSKSQITIPSEAKWNSFTHSSTSEHCKEAAPA